MIVQLAKSYPSIHGTPAISCVDTAIFSETYFARCLQCDFCFDSCCSYGVDIDKENHTRIYERTADLEEHLGTSREMWFDDELEPCDECPGAALFRTKNPEQRCVFLNTATRGCGIHGFCHTRSLDYHHLKPLVCSLFPITFADSTLRQADEVIDRTLICLGKGETLYRGVREEIEYYWGKELVAELDQLQNQFDGNAEHS